MKSPKVTDQRETREGFGPEPCNVPALTESQRDDRNITETWVVVSRRKKGLLLRS